MFCNSDLYFLVRVGDEVNSGFVEWFWGRLIIRIKVIGENIFLFVYVVLLIIFVIGFYFYDNKVCIKNNIILFCIWFGLI